MPLYLNDPLHLARCIRVARDRVFGPITQATVGCLLTSLMFTAGCGSAVNTPRGPLVTLSATNVDFATATVGASSSPSTVTVTNTGGQPLLFGSPRLSDTADFAVSTNCPPSLPAAASCALTVQFHPQSAEPISATVTLTDNSDGVAGAQQVVNLTGAGTPMPVSQAAVTPAGLTFGPTALGATSTSQTVSLGNTGTAPLAISSMTLSDPADFTLTSTCGADLAVGAVCTLGVAFKPQALGPFVGTLTVIDNSGDQTGAQQVIALTGTGTPVPTPRASITPDSLTFDPAILGTASTPQLATLTNTGTAPLEITATTVSDPARFTLASQCPGILAPSATCTLTIAAQPQTIGALIGTLTITDDSGGVPGAQQALSLSATGLPVPLAQAALASSTLTFAPTVIGTHAATQALLLTNTGTAPLAISGIALADSVDYALSSTCGPTLPAGQSCTLAVSFQPQKTGSLSTTLTLTDNSGVLSGTGQQTITVAGSGLPIPIPQAGLTPSTGSFGSQTVSSSSAPQTFSLSNTGTSALAINSLVLSDTVNFGLTNTCGASLDAGLTCSFTVAFHPQTVGPLAASITIADNSGGSIGAQQTVSLNGTGVPLPAPQATLSGTALTFADTMATTTSGAQTVLLTNSGNAPLTLSASTLSDTQNFSLTSTCGATIPASASCILSVTFQPQTEATFQATLALTDNSGAITGTQQQTVTLIGKGVPFSGPRAAVSPASLTFPQTVTNSSAAPQTVTLTNTGTSSLTISSVALTGAAAPAFTLSSGTCVGALAAGASCTGTVVFSPTLASSGATAGLVFTDDSLSQAGATQTVPLSGTALAEIDSVTNFGDSITCGFYAQPNDATGYVYSLEGYAGLFDTFLGVPATNVCRQGDTAADMSRLWVPFHSTPAATGNQLYTMMIGTNDAYRYGIPQASLDTYTQEVGAALSWLALPDTAKVLANTITQRTGTWTADVGFGLQSTDSAASLSFPVTQATAGSNLYLVYHVWALPSGQAGKATIAVDGNVLAAVDESQNSNVRIPTENGTSDTYLLQTVPLGAVGQHTVTFSSAGPAGSMVGLLWAGVPQADYHAVDGAPRVLLGLITNSPSGNQTYGADVYNLQLKSLVPALSADGLNVTIVPTDRVLDVNTDFNDILHPNTQGHAKLAGAFEQYR